MLENFWFSLNVSLPIFLLLAAGFGIKRLNLLDDSFFSQASSLVFTVALPAKLFYDTDTLVTEGHVGSLVVLIGSAETGGGYFDEDLVVLEVRLGGLRLDDLALLGALVDGEGRHLGGCVV